MQILGLMELAVEVGRTSLRMSTLAMIGDKWYLLRMEMVLRHRPGAGIKRGDGGS